MSQNDDVSLVTYSIFPRILAPTTYIFFASAIPVISFGEQLERDTGTLLFDCCLNFATNFQVSISQILARVGNGAYIRVYNYLCGMYLKILCDWYQQMEF